MFAALTPLLRLPVRMAALRRARSFHSRDPRGAQRALLPWLVSRATVTAFGQQHGFPALAGLSPERLYRQYCRQVPIRTYRQFWDSYFGPCLQNRHDGKKLELRDLTWPGLIPWLCETSGTTAPTKYIPFSNDMFAANRRAALDMMACYLAAKPESRLIGNTMLYMAGPTSLTRMGDGVQSGDMSAITLQQRPFWLEPFVEPKEPLSSATWEQRLGGMARLLIEDRRIRAISGVPPWILLLLKQVELLSGRSVSNVLPHLELIIHGGASLAPYRDEFLTLFGERMPDLLELLPSSEAFMGFQAQGEQGMRLTPFYGCFFEFVPMEQLDESGAPQADAVAVPLWEVVPGQRYAVILSTCAGLWRYHIGDTLRFLDTEQYRIEFTGRDKFLDRFEEKVTQGEAEAAVAAANEQLGIAVREFMVGPDIGARRHCWVLACRSRAVSAAQVSAFLDRALMTANADYATFRSQGRIHAPLTLLADEDLIYRWSQEARGKLGGQSKIPHIDPTPTGGMVADLRTYIQQHSSR
ncbi:GH3 family domain-containing protein [Trichlorobacter ammonificans]|uniref:GH3 auxin-responsive promoter n=1 Tax=Trichlorobacter ammonificans TaxID=2916410 RepID=A0ABN8HNC7_9BACT|nr:GH3 auxin-responsive promoter family protein [Trichlorobacter ammonificans]CAH2032488.1 GH3 auxin-responsive promoter [Trichlorobacter ammonificans]